jgi:basic membrane lipoprotein Med (substrate-binding protein (PBP1-ABC) superfamily)
MGWRFTIMPWTGFVKSINKMNTKVKVKCISKKESANYDKENPIATAIELEVPYGQDSIYWKLSGGTNMTLNTVNKDAADMFVIGNDYDMVISPSVAE